MATIFHITTRDNWKRAEAERIYRAESLPTEGFIHCSTREQVVRTADRFFRGRRGLVLLSIDTERVAPEIRYENSEGDGQMFPHVYGELNTDAVTRVSEFEPDGEGLFALPELEGEE
jgi:uncharacterized protein (DUF952 family)